jgi:cell division septum initiation protein DivIVA
MQDYLLDQLRRRVDDLEREVADLRLHNEQLRETVKALLAPTSATRKPDFESPMRW